MKKLILFISISGILSGCSGQKAVVSEIGNYKPPAIYQTAAPMKAKIPPARKNKDFQAQKAKLEELKKSWEKALTEPENKDDFYTPAPERLKSFSDAFTDDKAAEAKLADGFTSETLEILAYARNPMVKAAEKNFHAVLEAYSQAANMEDIVRQYSAFTAGNMTGVGNMEDTESVSKKFPFPGILALKGEIVGQEAKAAYQDLEIARRTAITEAGKIFHNLLYNIRAKEITRQTLGLFNNLELSAAKRYESGQARLRELTQVRIRKDKMRTELISFEENSRNLDTRLRSLLLLPAAIKIGIPANREIVKPLPSPDDLIALAFRKRQELKKMRAMLAKTELMVVMAEAEIYPGFTHNYSLTENRAVNQAGTMKMEEPFPITTTSSMGAGLPKMPWTGLSEAYLREARQKLEALRRELSGAEADAAMKVREAWFEADQAKRETALYKERITELSQLDFDVSAKAYESGMMPFSEIIESAMFMLETKLAVEKRKTDFGIAMAVLEETIGISEK